MKKLYAVLIVILLVGVTLLGMKSTSYVDSVLQSFEESQPEKCMDELMSCISVDGNSEDIQNLIIYPEVSQLPFDKKVDLKQEWIRLLQGGELSYKISTGQFSETGQFYQIMKNDEPIALVELESSNEVQKLGILKVADWAVKSIKPVVTLQTYNYTIRVPEGSTVRLNDVDILSHETDKDMDVYTIEGLYYEPDIKLVDRYGFTMVYDIVDNIVTPITHKFNLMLPTTYSIYLAGNEIEPLFKASDEEVMYSITTANPSITISDKYGNMMEYTGEESIKQYSRQINVPDSYSVMINGDPADEFFVFDYSYPKYNYCGEWVDVPYGKSYLFEEFLVDPDIRVVDNLGEEVVYDKNERLYINEEIVGTDDYPEIFTQDGFDAWDMAKTWNLFMTDDLGGSDNGFSIIKKYLIKDSYMYKVAYKWTTGIDITLTSAHNTSDNYFEEERIGNFKKYGENFYSFDVHIVKYMYLYKSNRWVDDIMNSTFYVMRDENGCWVILDIQEILN